MLLLENKIIDAIAAHSERDYPSECGGMLIGEFLNGHKVVRETFPLQNAREEAARHNRVLILPGDVLKAEKFARETNREVIGYYHSHPDDAAVPSQYDLDHALPVWSYVIASVIKGRFDNIRSWELQHDRARFDEEQIGTVYAEND